MENTTTNEEEVRQEELPMIRKVFIRGYGNLTLEIKATSHIGIEAYSERNNELLVIPWTSIIMISDKVRHDGNK